MAPVEGDILRSRGRSRGQGRGRDWCEYWSSDPEDSNPGLRIQRIRTLDPPGIRTLDFWIRRPVFYHGIGRKSGTDTGMGSATGWDGRDTSHPIFLLFNPLHPSPLTALDDFFYRYDLILYSIYSLFFIQNFIRNPKIFSKFDAYLRIQNRFKTNFYALKSAHFPFI